MGRLVGIYLTAEAARRDPAYLDALQTGVGLNQVILSGPVCLSPATLALNPFAGGDRAARLRELAVRRLSGEPLIDEGEARAPLAGRFPPADCADDDSPLRAAIALCHERGLAVWYLAHGWTYRRTMLCPSKPALDEGYRAAFAEIARSYPFDAVDVTHARYPLFGFPEGLEVCACDDCAAAAGELGYDLRRIAASLREIPARLARWPAATLAQFVGRSPGLPETIELLGLPAAWLDWLYLRAELIARRIAQFRRAVHAAAGRPILFGSDTYPPALALLVGHRYAAWPTHSDFTSPLLSHVEAFVTQGFARWSQRLCQAVPGLGEATALSLLYRLTGYDGLGMPLQVSDFYLGERDCEFRRVPLQALMERDLAKARLFASREIPCYPIIQGGVWPREVVRRLVEYAEEVGHEGIIFQGTDSLVDYQPK